MYFRGLAEGREVQQPAREDRERWAVRSFCTNTDTLNIEAVLEERQEKRELERGKKKKKK